MNIVERIIACTQLRESDGCSTWEEYKEKYIYKN